MDINEAMGLVGQAGGAKIPKRAKAKRSSSEKKKGKKTSNTAKAKAKKWVRTLRKTRGSDGTMRTVWKNAQTGDYAVRRIRGPVGARKAVYAKIT
jgi:hypothetical protein